jgi:hypothetical protein
MASMKIVSLNLGALILNANKGLGSLEVGILIFKEVLILNHSSSYGLKL